jgi:hypothetical protein
MNRILITLIAGIAALSISIGAAANSHRENGGKQRKKDDLVRGHRLIIAAL